MTEGQKRMIESFQADYLRITGAYIRIVPCTQWEFKADLGEPIEFWKLVRIVFDFTGWTFKDTYNKSRKEEACFRRSLIDFIAVNNGTYYNHCAKFTGRDHTTIMHSVTSFENRLETQDHTRRLFSEVIRYVKDNYYIYKDLTFTRESFGEGT
jgi:chromosomal replication initiation ATPase DnaA